MIGSLLAWAVDITMSESMVASSLLFYLNFSRMLSIIKFNDDNSNWRSVATWVSSDNSHFSGFVALPGCLPRWHLWPNVSSMGYERSEI